MSNNKYRARAHKALQRARAELDSKDDDRLRYAALELRMAFECLAYERAEIYKAELPADKFKTWQPKQLLAVLLEVDPSADKTRSIAYAPESSPGVTSGPFKPLGTDRIVSIKEVRDFYNKLGSYLHVPTISEIEAGQVTTPVRMRKRCEQVARIIDEALASPVRASDFRVSATMQCERCQYDIIKRMPKDNGGEVDATCPSCGAGYTIAQPGGNKVEWKAKAQEVVCQGPSCDAEVSLWPDQIEAGREWKCSECGGVNQIGLAIRFVPSEAAADSEDAASLGEPEDLSGEAES